MSLRDYQVQILFIDEETKSQNGEEISESPDLQKNE